MNYRQLKRDAAAAVEREPKTKELVLIYAGVLIAASLLVTALNFCLDEAMSSLGGLSNIGARSLLSTVQTLLPLAQSLALMCMEVGFLNGILRTVRGQFVSRNSLRLGFDRFWPLLRLMLLEGLLYFAVSFGCSYLAVLLFLMTPFSTDAMAISEYAMNSPGGAMAMDEAVQMEFLASMAPMLPFLLVLLAAFLVPLSYQLRMAPYVLIDKPALGARGAMRQSRMMMRGNCRKVFVLDLSFWWYHLLCFAATALAYGDLLLPLLGVSLPLSATVSYFLFYILYLAAQFVIYRLFLCRVTAAYALTYDVIRPKDPPTQGVVLGNIFQM